MYLPKPIYNYVKNREKNAPTDITEIRDALRRSGHKNYIVLLTDSQKFVLLDTDKDVTPGVVIENNSVVDFQNTDDYQAVTVDACARCTVLNNISDSADLERVKEIFGNKKTWVIHCVSNEEDNSFEAHTHGMANYSHPDFRIRKNVGEEEIAYLLNTLCKSVQHGNIFKDKNKIENMYENFDVVLSASEDGFFDVTLEELKTKTEEN